MKTKILIISLIFCGFFNPTSAQKVKIKKGVAYVNGKEYLGIKNDPVLNISQVNIYDLQDSILLNCKVVYYYLVNVPIYYYEIRQASSDSLLFECMADTKQFIRYLYNGKVIKFDGTIDGDRLDSIAKQLGKEHTRLRKELN